MVLTKALPATLIYSDIFDFPLTKEELLKYYLYEKVTEKKLDLILSKNASIQEKNGYYFLKGRSAIVTKREERIKESTKKITTAKKIIHLLSFLPTIQLIGISGSVAVFNADKNDDIDLFIIAQTGTLWITRLLVTLLLFIIGKKRQRNSTYTSNSVCANMFLDENELKLPQNKQNLYTAHEAIQMMPIFVRNNMDIIFIHANSWLTTYLPNSSVDYVQILKKRTNAIIDILERIAKFVQLAYMKRHRTTEIITKNMLAFHPEDKEEIILRLYNEKIKKYEI